MPFCLVAFPVNPESQRLQLPNLFRCCAPNTKTHLIPKRDRSNIVLLGPRTMWNLALLRCRLLKKTGQSSNTVYWFIKKDSAHSCAGSHEVLASLASLPLNIYNQPTTISCVACFFELFTHTLCRLLIHTVHTHFQGTQPLLRC